MSIKGKYKDDLKDLEMDSRIYLCLKQIGWANIWEIHKGEFQIKRIKYFQV